MTNVEEYCEKLGWYLVTIPAGTKGSTRFWLAEARAGIERSRNSASVLRAKPHP